MANGARSFLIKFIGDSKHLQGETDAVTGRLGKIKAAVGEADGVFGKLKAGGGAALQGVGGAGAVAAAGVAAAAAAAAKGLMDFQRLGLEVGKGAEATGLSTEAYSRWKEVAGDAGIEGAAFEGVVGKFNKTMAASPAVLDRFGVEIVKNKDGVTDVNETFLNAIDTLNAIKDPAERAEAGAKLFGRSWQGMAELISRGSGQLRTDLAAVSDAKVFDDKKVEDARKLRDAFDEIKDAGEDLFLIIGQTLAPVIADLAPMVADVIEQVKPLAEGFGDLVSGALQLVGPLLDLSNALLGPLAEGLGKALTFVGDLVGGLGDMSSAINGGKQLDALADQVTEQATAQKEARDAIVKTNESFDDAAAKAEYYASRVEAATDKTIEMTDAYDELAGELADTKSWIDAQQAVLSYKEKVDDATASNLDKQAALVDVKSKLLDYVSSLQGVPPEKQTAIIALIDAGKIEEAEAALAVLARPRDAVINPRTGGQAPVADRRAAGGPVTGGRAYLVGDNPDGSINETTELFVPNGSGQILNPRDTRRALAASARSAAGDGPEAGPGLTVVVQLTGPVLGVDQLEQTIRDAALRAFDERARQNRGNT